MRPYLVDLLSQVRQFARMVRGVASEALYDAGSPTAQAAAKEIEALAPDFRKIADELTRNHEQVGEATINRIKRCRRTFDLLPAYARRPEEAPFLRRELTAALHDIRRFASAEE
jgi:hypothetical protein